MKRSFVFSIALLLSFVVMTVALIYWAIPVAASPAPARSAPGAAGGAGGTGGTGAAGGAGATGGAGGPGVTGATGGAGHAGATPEPAGGGMPVAVGGGAMPPADTVINVRLDPHAAGNAVAAFNGRLISVDDHWLVVQSSKEIFYIPLDKVLCFTVAGR